MSDEPTEADIEQYRITDTDGDVFASLRYVPNRPGAKVPSSRFESWVVNFRNGDRLTGEPANEVARLLMNDGEDGLDAGRPNDRDAEATAMLDTLVYDDDSDQYRITVRGVRVWFGGAGDQGDDVVLYESRDCESRTGVIEDAPFDSGELLEETSLVRRHGGRF